MVTACFKTLALAASLLGAARHAQAMPLDLEFLHRDDHGAVASESSICSHIGIELMKQGGNAADALVGTTLCVGVIGMYHSGIGGGGFALVRTPKGKYEFIDFRETAPAGASEDMYVQDPNKSIFGGLASGVPGELRGLQRLHKYGKLSWEHVVMPAVKVAREGWEVGPDLVRYMDQGQIQANSSFLINDPNWSVDFAPEGTLLKLGDTITRKRYADTLEMIAQHGPDAFYSGHIAETMIAAVQGSEGILTMEDLKNYKVEIRKPAEITYRGFKMTSCSAPSGGIVALSTMKTIEGYDMAGNINKTTHLLDEAIRFAYGARTELGDPSFLKNMTIYQEKMLSEAHAKEVRSKINPATTLAPAAYNPKGLESLDTPGTSHVVAADKSGMAVTLTTTVNLLFGSTLIIPETGIIMNNEMNDFSIPGTTNAFGYIPSPANFIRPGKRPLSSIAPTIIEKSDGSLYFICGSAGGSRIITATIQNMWHVLDQGMSAVEAIAMPRLHEQLTPNVVTFEYAYNNETTAYMKSLGHQIAWTAPIQSTAQQIRVLPNGTFEAASEPRQINSGGYAF